MDEPTAAAGCSHASTSTLNAQKRLCPSSQVRGCFSSCPRGYQEIAARNGTEQPEPSPSAAGNSSPRSRPPCPPSSRYPTAHAGPPRSSLCSAHIPLAVLSIASRERSAGGSAARGGARGRRRGSSPPPVPGKRPAPSAAPARPAPATSPGVGRPGGSGRKGQRGAG